MSVPSAHAKAQPKHALKWRRVNVDHDAMSSMEGFVGLEEIVDYNIVSKNGVSMIKVRCIRGGGDVAMTRAV